jgi:cytidylate kinase
MAYVVTISATFGAGGSVIGPALAERLGVPFLDRAVPSAVARDIGCSLEDALERDDRAPTGFERFLVSAARLPTVTLGGADPTYIGPVGTEGRVLYDAEFVEHTEGVIRGVADTGGVVLGRAAALVLADHPQALHVRLDGPETRRLTAAARLLDQADELPHDADPTAGHAPTLRELHDNDRARAAYVRRFYRADAAAPKHYHVVLDSTVLSADACVDLLDRLTRERAGKE